MLTETWAAAYFQALVMVLIFMLGIPALLLQLIAPNADLSRLVQRRFRFGRQAYLILLGATAAVILFAWSLHPDNTPWPSPALSYANLTITLAIVFSVSAWVYYLHCFTRAGILRRIRRTLERSHVKLARTNDLAEQSLAMLGEMSRSGVEKADVIAAYQSIFEVIFKTEAYSGNGLLGLVQGLSSTVIGPENPGNEQNLSDGASLLLWTRSQLFLRFQGNASKTSDLLWVENALAEFACFAAFRGFQECQRILTYLAPEKLMQVGIAACDSRHVTIYTNSINKLRSRRERASADGALVELIDDCLITLLAHISQSGATARLWSARQIRVIYRDISTHTLNELMDHSWTSKFNVGDFRSADAIDSIRATLLPALPPVKSKGSERSQAGKGTKKAKPTLVGME
jgi:hypothetical protein